MSSKSCLPSGVCSRDDSELRAAALEIAGGLGTTGESLNCSAGGVRRAPGPGGMGLDPGNTLVAGGVGMCFEVVAIAVAEQRHSRPHRLKPCSSPACRCWESAM